jgi:DNA (cytosine-5)-methyltransferase 1
MAAGMKVETKVRCLELFGGIGGFAAAVGDRAQVVAAIDLSEHALRSYRVNFDHDAFQANLDTIPRDRLEGYDAQMWWLSPPCQPYTVRGNRADVKDARARSLIHLLDCIDNIRPRHIALENVMGFQTSQARALLVGRLESCAYRIVETSICPTTWGVPNRRPRYYLVASLDPLTEPSTAPLIEERVHDYLSPDADVDANLIVPSDVIARYGKSFRIIEPTEPDATTTCFTSGYAKSWSYTGSYMRRSDGRVRRFAPEEILRLLHFPDCYSFATDLSLKQRWKLAGNSLSVIAVRWLLSHFPWFGSSPHERR